MKKKKTQEEISFRLPDTMIYNQRTTKTAKKFLSSIQEDIKKAFFITAIFGSYSVLNLSVILFNNFEWYLPLFFSSCMAVILRIIIGPITSSSSKNTQIIPQKDKVEIDKYQEVINNPLEISKTTYLKCNSCGKLTGNDPLKTTSFCKSCRVEFTKRPNSKPIGITARKKLGSPSVRDSTIPVTNTRNLESKTENISEYLTLISETFHEERKDYSQNDDSPEDLFLKKLDDVQKLLKLKQDKIRRFKAQRKDQVKTYVIKKKVSDLETVKNVNFTCQACDIEYEGSIKRINGSLFVEHKKEDLILQKTNSGYIFYFEHMVEKTTHQTFINLGKGFNVLSSEVIISVSRSPANKKKDTTTISDQEKFIPNLSYPCSLCKIDFKVNDYVKIKYESANQSTFVHIQTQHSNNGQHHLATLRIDLIDKMLVATPNVHLITPIQIQEELEESEDQDDQERFTESKVTA
ncbi:MAG: hypothetical protein HeimC3_13910 [Candidatus Heimdallarchaeota archaeon LC_3]|nr:MAG: hypothetical protein HeimC3_13910 [Candidatus Heimdallarchaeota archaeon LC_3]